MKSVSLWVFWSLLFIMTLLAMAGILPWLKTMKKSICVSLWIAIVSFGLYLKLGNAHFLKDYYSKDHQARFLAEENIRPLMTLLNKEEIKCRIKLEESPDDIILQCQLLDILAIRALEANQKELALEYWTEALARLPKDKTTENMRKRILTLKENLKKM